MYSSRDVAEVARTTVRILTFRAAVPDMKRLGALYVGFGLACAWLVGVGRHMYSPDVALWQKLGLASIVYVLLMALILWLVVMPLGPRNWSYRNVLVFVAMTSPPGLIYALPVESFLAAAEAVTARRVMLAVVATWRVALLFAFLSRAADLRGPALIAGALMPLVLIVDTLHALDLTQVVFQSMGGGRSSPGETAISIVAVLVLLALMALPVLILVYAVIVIVRMIRRRNS